MAYITQQNMQMMERVYPAGKEVYLQHLSTKSILHCHTNSIATLRPIYSVSYREQP